MRRIPGVSSIVEKHALILLCILLIGMGPVGINLLVDPFDRDAVFALGLDKKRVAEKRHAQLYKSAAYRRNPSPYVVLGDSRSRALREKYFTGTRFPGFYNLAFGGGTLPEAFDAYWDAVAQGELKGVVLGVPLRMFSERYKRGKNQVAEAQAWLNDPWRYYASGDVQATSLDVLEASLSTPMASWIARVRHFDLGLIGPANAAAKTVTPKDLDAEARKRARKWRTQIDIAARSDWRTFRFSERYFAELERVAADAKSRGIRLVLFIPPTPVEMQRRIEDFDRTRINFTFRKRLAELAPVVDFDFYSPWTEDTENFRDAYHFGSSFARQISAELIRFFDPSDKAARTIAKRRDGVFCPTARTDPGARVVEGEITLLVGESCRVWISQTEDQS